LLDHQDTLDINFNLRMTHKYSNPKTGSHLHMTLGKQEFKRSYAHADENNLLTIVWNQGADQQVIIDDIHYNFPSQSVLPLMSNNTFSFSDPQHIIGWQFNREFYCIIDHDKEVSCVGFIFYGTNDQLFIKLDEKNQSKLQALKKVFVDEYEEDTDIKEEMLRMLLKRLIILITRLGKQQYLSDTLDDTEVDIIREFNLLLEQNFKEYHQVQDYANLMHKSPKTLSNLFSKYNSLSPIQVIKNRLLQEAKRLLTYSEMTTKEIGYELGFDDPSTFSRFFKNGLGISPSNYKKSLF